MNRMATVPLEVRLEPDSEAIIPLRLYSFLNRFLIDKKTGNVTLNVRDGQILGFRVEEIHSLK